MTDIKLFLSWARDDAELKNSFLSVLKPRLKNLRGHTVTWWEDSFLLPGEEWTEEIITRFEEANYIVQLISPSFLASNFIQTYEIPGVGNAPLKKTLPVMLVNVPLDGSMDFHQIDKKQIYYFQQGTKRLSFDSRETLFQRNQFVDGFVAGIIQRFEGTVGYR